MRNRSNSQTSAIELMPLTSELITNAPLPDLATSAENHTVTVWFTPEQMRTIFDGRAPLSEAFTRRTPLSRRPSDSEENSEAQRLINRTWLIYFAVFSTPVVIGSILLSIGLNQNSSEETDNQLVRAGVALIALTGLPFIATFLGLPLFINCSSRNSVRQNTDEEAILRALNETTNSHRPEENSNISIRQSFTSTFYVSLLLSTLVLTMGAVMLSPIGRNLLGDNPYQKVLGIIFVILGSLGMTLPGIHIFRNHRLSVAAAEAAVHQITNVENISSSTNSIQRLAANDTGDTIEIPAVASSSTNDAQQASAPAAYLRSTSPAPGSN